MSVSMCACIPLRAHHQHPIMIPENNRLPLAEFSSSRINRLVSCSKMYDKPAKTLPSIRALIHHSPYEKRSRTAPEPAPQPQSTCIQEIDSASPNYNALSQKLRVRLQFAYYKYKTNQTTAKFRDLRRQSQRRHSSNKRPKLSKRKLMVSHGNFRTPAKTSHLIGAHERGAESGQRLNFSDAPHDATTITATMTTTTTTITTATPIGKMGKFFKQETPMSVKAAKSLIHLFTSNQH